jgi:hypothetical protein
MLKPAVFALDEPVLHLQLALRLLTSARLQGPATRQQFECRL